MICSYVCVISCVKDTCVVRNYEAQVDLELEYAA